MEGRQTQILRNSRILSSSAADSFSIRGDVPFTDSPFDIDVSLNILPWDTSAAFMAFGGATHEVEEWVQIRHMQQYLVANESRILEQFWNTPLRVSGLLLLYGTTKISAWCSGIARGFAGTIAGRIHITPVDMSFTEDINSSTTGDDNHSLDAPSPPRSSWSFSHGPAGHFIISPLHEYCAVVRPILMRRRGQLARRSQGRASTSNIYTSPGNGLDDGYPASGSVLQDVLDSVLQVAPDIDAVVGDWSVITTYVQLYGTLPDNNCIKYICAGDDRHLHPARRVRYLRRIAKRSAHTEPLVVVEEEDSHDSALLAESTESPTYAQDTNPFRSMMRMTRAVGSASAPSGERWVEAVEAYKHADAAQAALPALKEQLNEARDALSREHGTLLRLVEQNKATFSSLPDNSPTTTKVSLISLFKRKASKPSTSQGEAHPRRPSTEQAFEASYVAEIRAKENEERTRSIVEELTAQYEYWKEIGATVSKKFESVREMAEILFPPSTVAHLPRLAEATRSLLTEDERVDISHRTMTDIVRARRAAQQAHKYLHDVCRRCKKGRSANETAAGSFGAMWQIEALHVFQGAIGSSVNSQTCLDECLNILQRHSELLPQDQALYAQKLRIEGVSQVQRMCAIMSDNTMPRGVNRERQLDILDSGQKDAYDYLTKLAVWLQDQVPLLQIVQDDAVERRRIARRYIVDIWEDEYNAHQR